MNAEGDDAFICEWSLYNCWVSLTESFLGPSLTMVIDLSEADSVAHSWSTGLGRGTMSC